VGRTGLPRPLVIYLHGGGFALGDLDSHDSICRRLAWTADVAVLAVAYRRAPEHPAPAPAVKAVSAFTWAGQRLDELGGDAASGTGAGRRQRGRRDRRPGRGPAARPAAASSLPLA
jgi:acetyl esterase